MAKLYFYYSAMNAGKSTMLLQSAYNYRERGMNPLLLTPELDDRYHRGRVTSRIGLDAEARPFSHVANLMDIVAREHQVHDVHCVLVDEAQFLTGSQVRQLTDVVDQLHIPVLAYGLRTDFLGNLFEGSQYLLAWADTISELKTICHCGRKATMVLRLDDDGKPVRDGDQIRIGGNERYLSVCRLHHRQGMADPVTDRLPFEDSE